MGTVHQLPESFRGPAARQGNYWQLNKAGKLPLNVQRIRPMAGDLPLPEKRPMRPEAYIIFALITALEGRTGLKTIREDAFQEVVSMYRRWGVGEDVNGPMRTTMRPASRRHRLEQRAAPGMARNRPGAPWGAHGGRTGRTGRDHP